MKKCIFNLIFIFLFIFSENVFAFLPEIPGLINLNGYKSLTFSMTIEDTKKIMSEIGDGSLYGDFIYTIDLNENSVIYKYENKDKKLAYYLFFFTNEKTSKLYRIDISTKSSFDYNSKQDFYYPVVRSAVEEVLGELKTKYGKINDIKIKHYLYNNTPFEEYTYIFSSSYRSVSLSVMPDIETLKSKVPLFSYRLSFYDEILIDKYRKK